MPEISGSSFVLRPYRESDAEALVHAANNRNVWRNLGHAFPHPYTLQDANRWIASTAERPETDVRLAIVIDGTPCGGVGIHNVHLWSPYTYEIGYWLAEPLWGRGIVTEAAGLTTQYGFEELGAHRVQAYVFDWNPASERVLQKNGFALEGRLRGAVHKDGRTGDCLAYGRLR
jgi:RimJ/RimL family protein N-acetyltransferase